MRDLNDLAFFEAVVRHRGFASAARAMGIPKSKLSRHVTRLEAELGVRLLERSTRRFVVTELGQEFYRHCQVVIAEAEAADEVAARIQGEPRGLVRVSIPMGLSHALSQKLPGFLKAHPKLRVQLLIANRRVDIIGERVDIALRIRRRLDTDANLTMRTFGYSANLIVASPDLVAAFGLPATLDDLRNFPTLGHDEEPGDSQWVLAGPDGIEEAFAHEPRLACLDFNILVEAAVAGIGIACLPEEACRQELATGHLLHILPDWHGGRGIRHLVFTSRRGMLPSVRAVIDFLLANVPDMTVDRINQPTA
ncbi:MAG: LysR family transcriptional regulator [Rhodospirillaceae bacterium]|nr:LysR family transcriptional regulator [Rhodospirillaceae bacterium]